MLSFTVVGKITDIEVIASGPGIDVLAALRSKYGGKNWAKKKGKASVQLIDGSVRNAEIHWYEAHGVGKKETKIKRFLD
jgi:hypothetical protein